MSICRYRDSDDLHRYTIVSIPSIIDKSSAIEIDMYRYSTNVHTNIDNDTILPNMGCIDNNCLAAIMKTVTAVLAKLRSCPLSGKTRQGTEPP